MNVRSLTISSLPLFVLEFSPKVKSLKKKRKRNKRSMTNQQPSLSSHHLQVSLERLQQSTWQIFKTSAISSKESAKDQWKYCGSLWTKMRQSKRLTPFSDLTQTSDFMVEYEIYQGSIIEPASGSSIFQQHISIVISSDQQQKDCLCRAVIVRSSTGLSFLFFPLFFSLQNS